MPSSSVSESPVDDMNRVPDGIPDDFKWSIYSYRDGESSHKNKVKKLFSYRYSDCHASMSLVVHIEIIAIIASEFRLGCIIDRRPCTEYALRRDIC